MKLIPIYFALIFLAACGGKADKTKTHSADTTSKSAAPLVINNADTLTIDKNAAVIYRPDSAQIEKWKKTVGEKDFETAADDWSFYLNSTNEYLQTTKLPVEDGSGKKLLRFLKADGSLTMIRLDTLSNFWGCYLFSTTKEPLFADIVSFEESYKNYFK